MALPTDDTRFRRRVVIVAGIALAAVFVGIVLWIARVAIAIIYLSALVAIGLRPQVKRVGRWIGRRGRPARISRAALVVYLAAFAIVGLGAAFVIPAMSAQVSALRQSLPSMTERFQNALMAHGVIQRPLPIQDWMQQLVSVADATRTAMAAVIGVVGIISIVFLSYYFVVEGDAIVDRMLDFVPPGRRERARDVGCAVSDRLAAWFQATILLAVLMGVTNTVFLGFAGEPFFYVIGAIAAVGETVPMVGSFVTGVIATAIAATASVKLAVVVGLFSLAMHETESNVLVPRIMERRVGASAASLVAALLIGTEVGGVAGIVISVPTVAVLIAVLEVAYPRPEPASHPHTRASG